MTKDDWIAKAYRELMSTGLFDNSRKEAMEKAVEKADELEGDYNKAGRPLPWDGIPEQADSN